MMFHSLLSCRYVHWSAHMVLNSLRWSIDNAYMVHSVWMAELKFRIFTIDIEVWRVLSERTTNSV